MDDPNTETDNANTMIRWRDTQRGAVGLLEETVPRHGAGHGWLPEEPAWPTPSSKGCRECEVRVKDSHIRLPMTADTVSGEEIRIMV